MLPISVVLKPASVDSARCEIMGRVCVMSMAFLLVLDLPSLVILAMTRLVLFRIHFFGCDSSCAVKSYPLTCHVYACLVLCLHVVCPILSSLDWQLDKVTQAIQRMAQ